MSTPRRLALATAVVAVALLAGWGLLHSGAVAPVPLYGAFGALLVAAAFLAFTGWCMWLDERAPKDVPGQETPPAAARGHRGASMSAGNAGVLAGHPRHAQAITEEWETAPPDPVLPAAMGVTEAEPLYGADNTIWEELKALTNGAEVTP